MLALHQSELIARIPSIVVERDPARASVAHRVRGSIMSALNSASFAEARTKVLVVDDEQFLRSGLSEYLRHAGYSVAEAASRLRIRHVLTLDADFDIYRDKAGRALVNVLRQAT